MARLIKVIEVHELRGQGTKDDEVRTVARYYAPNGTLLAERDPSAHDGCNRVISEMEVEIKNLKSKEADHGSGN